LYIGGGSAIVPQDGGIAAICPRIEEQTTDIPSLIGTIMTTTGTI